MIKHYEPPFDIRNAPPVCVETRTRLQSRQIGTAVALLPFYHGGVEEGGPGRDRQVVGRHYRWRVHAGECANRPGFRGDSSGSFLAAVTTALAASE